MGLPADTYLLLHAFADELARCGMRVACTSPGSRCAPLVLTLAGEPRLRCYSHIDERCAGFFALGAAKASGLPVAVTCTSGTAAAELLPAAIEAHEARVPLLLLTADRPPELRENGAGQAIDQLKLYGDAAKWFFEVDAFEEASPARLRWIRTLACRAYWTALEGRPGVVHLNFPLREPLITDEPLPDDDTGRSDGSPYLRRTPPCASPSASVGLNDAARAPIATGAKAGPGATPGGTSGARPDFRTETGTEAQLTASTASAERGIVVAGRHERATPLGLAAARFCEATGWPLLADPMSGARHGTAAIAHYDALLRDEDFARAHRPDLVLRIGDLPVSKPLRTWLAELDDTTPQIALDPEGAWQDPASVLSQSLVLEPAAALRELSALISANDSHGADPPGVDPRAADPDWLNAWRSADERAAKAILGVIGGPERRDEPIDEPVVAAELGVLLPERATLFVASSMPVRDIETFWPVRADPPRVLCNRGANGIDGTVSSAFGAAAVAGGTNTAVETLANSGAGAAGIGAAHAGTGADTDAGTGVDADAGVDGGADTRADGPVVLLIGDVAFAHDLGGLLAATRLDLRLTIVLLDNGGGGIFDFLPVGRSAMAAAQDVYSHHIATPTGLDFQRAAELYGLAYERAETVVGLRKALERALEPDSASTLIHIRSDRAANVELHGRVWRAVSQALAEDR